MFKKTHTSKEYNCGENEECYCHESYKIIENYRSILDRKHQFITSWKSFDKNGKITFTHGKRIRKNSDALVIRINNTCLIHPWYKSIHINQNLRTIFQQNQSSKVYEIILLECNCLTNSHQYELAIIECPCLEQMKTSCTYCQLTLTATEHSNSLQLTQLGENVSQQTEVSFTLDFFNDEINLDESFYSQSGPYQYQRTVQIQVQSEEVLHAIMKLTNSPQLSLVSQVFNEDIKSETKSIALLSDNDIQQYYSNSISSTSRDTIESYEDLLFITRGTQTKLFAILLPQSPLSEMKSSKITGQTLMNVTRTCQVNTLSYLIKTYQSQTEVQHFPDNKTQLIKQSITEIKHQTSTDRKHYEQGVNVPTIEFEGGELLDNFKQTKTNSRSTSEEILSIKEHPEDFILTFSPLKCINTCDTIDFNEPNTAVNITSKSDKKSIKSIDNSNNNQQIISNHTSSRNIRSSKFFRLKINHYRNKKHTYGFLRRLHRRKKRTINNFEHNLFPPQMNPTSINLHRNNSNITRQYRAYDHTIVARASKNSLACEQIQTLLNNHGTSLEELIHSQLLLTCNDNYRSVCILIDDHKQSEKYRSSFLHYIYTILSNTLKKIFNDKSIELTCMNLVFFHNSLCDIVNMQRLRLIDTGKQILLLPSCEISLKTSEDINVAIDRLSTKMPFAHQIFIINFNHQQSSISGSFLFLQLAPICSIRPTGLLTNLNSSTYSVLNLIRQLNNGQLFKHNTTKRYLFNDCSLNRLLKNYLFSSQQTMTVLTVKPKV